MTTLDLRGVLCPLTWVRTRLALERLAPGEQLLVRLDPGEPIESVPRSAREEGHAVEVAGGEVRIVQGGRVTLGEAEVERYARQLVIPEWSGAAQERLRAASAIVVGAGALGSPVATYLVAAGIGRIGIVDSDAIELSNLQRQPLHFTPDVGLMKAENARVKLTALNPEVQVESYPVWLDAVNAEAIVRGADVVVDCSDSFATRYAVNAACCAQRIPLVEGGLLGAAGLVMAVVPGRSACYRCAFPVEPPSGSVPSCREAGALGAAAGVVGSLQALEALKLLTGVGEPLLDRILTVDGLAAAFTTVATERLPHCPDCGGAAAAQ